ncbi:S-adenosyl-L-methionine-dependent methyltransferase [Daedalea quercina L-15889]|uniref:S-adenosyl-L-methionine-dependent methyltransferase n=1 Tax=Daedalea quercina L-15889 TaxID=1314783 RepID=A0A165TW72_9APHY|nr:S-adenosyl-L-methionine-dependent methyltransferase [Daedalea quercina L-15889]
MRQRYPDLFDEDTTTLMDYACGTGLISRELCPYVKSIVGVDISQGMIDQFNLRVSNQGLAPEEMRAVCVDLKQENHELHGTKFDVIVCSMAYHHFPSIEDVTRLLASFLQAGGSLLVADIYRDTLQTDIFPHEHGAHVHEHIVAHQRGFDEGDMRRTFKTAGLELKDFGIVTSGKMHGKDVDFFVAHGLGSGVSP